MTTKIFTVYLKDLSPSNGLSLCAIHEVGCEGKTRFNGLLRKPFVIIRIRFIPLFAVMSLDCSAGGAWGTGGHGKGKLDRHHPLSNFQSKRTSLASGDTLRLSLLLGREVKGGVGIKDTGAFFLQYPFL